MTQGSTLKACMKAIVASEVKTSNVQATDNRNKEALMIFFIKITSQVSLAS